ncbi:MAG: hypothetical protein H0U23_13985 [Blastocatellia bacterium]|nr:hypothetical protein [Blastocatellia bacterium]
MKRTSVLRDIPHLLVQPASFARRLTEYVQVASYYRIKGLHTCSRQKFVVPRTDYGIPIRKLDLKAFQHSVVVEIQYSRLKLQAIFADPIQTVAHLEVFDLLSGSVA